MRRFIELMQEGGAGMLVLVGIGVVALVTAFLFAVRPSTEQVGFLKWMSRALAAASLTCFLLDVASTLHAVASKADIDPQLATRIIEQGFSESCAPGVLGGAFLTLVALLAAVGQRRLDARKP